MRVLLTIITFLYLSVAGLAQCEDKIAGKTMQKGMFIFCNLGTKDGKNYAAEVLSVNGTNFSCRFLHSQSVYQFTDFKRADKGTAATMQAVVKSSVGGGYKQGQLFIMNVLMPDPEACDLSGATRRKPYEVIVTFKADNKRYLGWIMVEDDMYTIQMAHTNSIYIADKNFKVIKVGRGGYAVGSQLSVAHARTLVF